MTAAPVGFYHLTRQGEARALARLLGRTLESGNRALVLLPDEARLGEIDEALWLQDDVPWLPHGTVAMGEPGLQPVWLDVPDRLGTAPAPNSARYLFCVGGAAPRAIDEFERIFDLFDSRRDGEIEAARSRYRAARAAGHEVAYWREGERGWEKPA